MYERIAFIHLEVKSRHCQGHMGIILASTLLADAIRAVSVEEVLTSMSHSIYFRLYT